MWSQIATKSGPASARKSSGIPPDGEAASIWNFRRHGRLPSERIVIHLAELACERTSSSVESTAHAPPSRHAFETSRTGWGHDSDITRPATADVRAATAAVPERFEGDIPADAAVALSFSMLKMSLSLTINIWRAAGPRSSL